MVQRIYRVLGLLSVVILVSSSAGAQQGAPANGEWSTYGGDLGGTKYSPLDQIDATNFGDLEIAWRWQSTDAFMSKTTASGGEWWAASDVIFEALNTEDPDRWRDGQPPYTNNLKATPLMVGGRLFINMPTSAGAAVDAATGETLWVYNPKTYEAGTTTMTARWNQRGVAYWGDSVSGRVFWGTSNGYLICVEAASGRPCTDFGENGRVDLMRDIPRADRDDRDWLNALLYSVQSPPIVVGDTVITPASISSYNITREAPPGWMRGFDVRSGRTKWTFHTIPQGDEFGNGHVGWRFLARDRQGRSLVDDERRRGARSSLSPHQHGRSRLLRRASTRREPVRRERGGAGFGDRRAGLALPGGAPRAVGLRLPGGAESGGHRGGRTTDQGTGSSEQAGFMYVFDRVTGEPVWPIEERSVPTDTDIEGELPWPTQPFPTRPAPFEYQGATIDDLVDFTPEIRQMAVEAVDGFRLGPLFTPQPDRHPPATQHRRRRQLVGRRGRPRDRAAVCAVGQQVLSA